MAAGKRGRVEFIKGYDIYAVDVGKKRLHVCEREVEGGTSQLVDTRHVMKCGPFIWGWDDAIHPQPDDLSKVFTLSIIIDRHFEI